MASQSDKGCRGRFHLEVRVLAVINYYEFCNLIDIEECESVVKAKTLLLLAGYLPHDKHPYVWRKDYDKTALIVPIDADN